MNDQQRAIINAGLDQICARLTALAATRSPAIVRNSAKCKACHDHVESTHTRHFAICKCGSVSVDGGHDYLRRVGNPELIEDTSLFAPIE